MKTRILALFIFTIYLLSVFPALSEAMLVMETDGRAADTLMIEGASDHSEELFISDGEEEYQKSLVIDLQTGSIDLELVGDLVSDENDLNAVVSNTPISGHQFVESVRPTGIPDNDALLAGYVDKMFGIGGIRDNGIVGDRLTGVTLKVYNFLVEQIKKVAAGKIESTEFRVPDSIVPIVQPYTELNELYDNFADLIYALIYDYPYELYWWNASAGENIRCDDEALYIGFPVTAEFAMGDYVIQRDKVKKVQVAANNARALVRKKASLSDFDKLCAYRDYILKAVDYYNYTSDKNDDPYELIWVFDDDPTTNVVCEGYSKAFQYLCEMSSFKSDIRCYRVGGTVYVDETMPTEIDMDYNLHAWNIVTMDDGKNYLVDLTNSDDGTPGGKQGTEGSLFLAGYDAVNGETYGVIAVERDNFTLWFAYTIDDLYRHLVPASAQKLAKKDYKASSQEPKKISFAEGKRATVTLGSKLKLTVILTPSGSTAKLKWSSSNTTVAKVSPKGVVTPKKTGTAKIKVTTDNGKSAIITINVKAKSAVKSK